MTIAHIVGSTRSDDSSIHKSQTMEDTANATYTLTMQVTPQDFPYLSIAIGSGASVGVVGSQTRPWDKVLPQSPGQQLSV